ncbi:MAG: DUF3782 domain-containing protein [Treponema sp.]|jgi:hypothetical protein|nr:DUF3782 domain-containing protein [Treponema sp.]
MAVRASKKPPSGRGLTYEKVWAMFQETREQFKETDRKFQEVAEQHKETERLFKETDKKFKETDRIVGNLGNRFGELVEHLVAPNIKEKFNELGYCFTKTAMGVDICDQKNLKDAIEVDVLLENGDVVMAVEVKAKPNIRDVNNHIRRIEILRRHADKNHDKRRYQGAIAGAIIGESARRYILEKGLYVIEQTGDTVQIVIPRGFKARDW